VIWYKNCQIIFLINIYWVAHYFLYSKAFIHYNGWDARWDEWLPLNSQRIAPFRTFTVQNPRSVYLSPFPNTVPDAEGFTAPPNPVSFESALPSFNQFLSTTQEMLSSFQTASALREQSRPPAPPEEEKKMEEEKGSSIDGSGRGVRNASEGRGGSANTEDLGAGPADEQEMAYLS